MVTRSYQLFSSILKKIDGGFGVFGLISFGMLGVSAFFWFQSNEYKIEAQDLNAKIQEINKRITVFPNPANIKIRSNNPLEDYENQYPEEKQRDRRIAALLAGIQREGLVNTQTEYRKVQTQDLDLIAYQINMPLTGSYEKIRHFLSKALEADPALSLINIRLKRKDGKTKSIQAQLEFILYMRTNNQPETAKSVNDLSHNAKNSNGLQP